MTKGGFHKELRLVLSRVRTCKLGTSLKFSISPRTSPKLGLVLTLCEIDPWLLHVITEMGTQSNTQRTGADFHKELGLVLRVTRPNSRSD